ncbi:MAG: hypothetical protein NVSMB26_22250 [Beijerinckiaceae bacterium]
MQFALPTNLAEATQAYKLGDESVMRLSLLWPVTTAERQIGDVFSKVRRA